MSAGDEIKMPMVSHINLLLATQAMHTAMARSLLALVTVVQY